MGIGKWVTFFLLPARMYHVLLHHLQCVDNVIMQQVGPSHRDTVHRHRLYSSYVVIDFIVTLVK